MTLTHIRDRKKIKRSLILKSKKIVKGVIPPRKVELSKDTCEKTPQRSPKIKSMKMNKQYSTQYFHFL